MVELEEYLLSFPARPVLFTCRAFLNDVFLRHLENVFSKQFVGMAR